MATIVRPADPDDADDVAALAALRRAWTEEDDGGPIADAAFDGAFAAWIEAEAGHRRYLLVEDGSTPIGMASLVLMRRMPRPGRQRTDWGYVHQVFVVAEHRRRGVGGLLMDAVIAAAAADGLTQLVLNPTQQSVPFYRRHGFVSAGHLLWRPLTE